MTWRDLLPSHDETHHLRDGVAAYEARFDAVMKFHAPGLAPVSRDGEAWHIDTTGEPAYARRFERAFGFYEGLAAVASHDGWHHITPEGRDAYGERYAWCGNFQERRCAVRDRRARYRHISPSGAPCGERTWRYAGDFRDGIAVVQGDDGRSTHVRLDGSILHGAWFEDLDVFHKGMARARDVRGWTHVDRDGRPAYTARFAMVEPFYNGQARVERFDGALLVIDSRGATIVEVRAPRRSELAALSGDLVGYWRTQTITVAVELGVFEALPAKTEEIAARCALSLDRTARLLRALAELRLVEPEGDTWRSTERGAFLVRKHPQTLADASREYAGRLGSVWAKLSDALRLGDAWRAPDVFAEVSREDPEVHHRMLRSYARHDYVAVPAALPLRGDEVILDAGGGLGVLAEGIAREWPRTRVMLLDRPEVAAMTEIEPALRPRVSVVAANLFAPWPARGDAVVLARVLHDWNDARAAEILGYARASLPPGGRLFVVEMVLPDDAPDGGLCDLHLLVATGGQERTRAAYERLLAASRFALREVRRIDALPSILIAEAV